MLRSRLDSSAAMPLEELHAALAQTSGVSVRAGELLSGHTPLRVGGPADLWAEVEDAEALNEVLRLARKSKVSWRVHWPLEDCLVRDAGFRGLIIRPGVGFEGAGRRGEGRVWLGAASPWAALTPLTLLTLTRWPGTVGGLFAAGEQDRLKGLGLTLRWQKGRRGIVHQVAPGEDVPSLKPTEILTELELDEEMPKRRRLKPPPGPGRIFSTPKSTDAGELLLRAGVCGARLRDWRLTPAEPGTVVHTGTGSCRDIMLLVRGVTERVQRARGVKLSLRIPVFGERTP
ncbi:MAG: UDP-N-acetylmuramate dehydrogenase [Myxococcota bacterium]|jgi:UDP-N-acetylmuramate dehydrogenase